MNDSQQQIQQSADTIEHGVGSDAGIGRQGPNSDFVQGLVGRVEELGEANMLNEALLNHVSHALVALNSSMRIVHTNRQFSEAFGVDNDVVRHEITLSQALVDDSLACVIDQCVTTGEPIRELEYTHSSNPGDDDRHFLLEISPFTTPSHQDGVLLSFHEVTEWKQRHTQVTEASRLVSIGEMAAGIAHEINNPLAAVMGFAQLAMRRDIDKSIRRDLDKILAESKRASKIIANLQSFARRYKPRQEPVNVIEILQRVLNFREYEMEVSNINVATKFDPRTPLVMGDEHQLDQVFLNMVINAEYMMSTTHGGGNLNIEVGRRDDKVFISFEDDGPGVEPDVMPKIFDPFFTTKEVGKGTGLGLSICYGIVHEHSGVIEVGGKPGHGATFTVVLPAPEIEAGADNEGAEQATSFASDARPLNVLIVDDEPMVVEFLARILNEFGHTVSMAENGNAVLEMTDLDSYDLIMLDVRMPGIGSETLFDHIRGLPGGVSDRVLYITGDATNPDTRAFIDRTGSPVLTKPFTIDDLLSIIGRMAAKHSRS